MLRISLGRVFVTAALVGATYPLALAGHLTVEWFAGDALLIREWQHGSQRAVAADVLAAWVASLAWAAAAWVVLAGLRRVLRGTYPLVAGAVSVGLVVAAAWLAVVPSLLAWLVLAAFSLGAAAEAFARRPAEAPP
jgi:hypothetical protein